MNETTDELMDATYAALCKHGYASLRMQDIADESSKSKATLHYYYDSKQDLHYALIETYLAPGNEDSMQEFRTALLEIKAQCPYDEQFRTELGNFDRVLHDRFQSILDSGQETDVFRDDFDPNRTADFIVTVLNRVQTRHVVVGHSPEQTRDTLETYITDHLLASDRIEVSLE